MRAVLSDIIGWEWEGNVEEFWEQQAVSACLSGCVDTVA